MQKAGFITELPSDPAPAAAPSPSEEQAMKQQLERTLAEQHIEWNDLKTRSRQKEIELAALRTNLEEVRREGEQDALESHLTTSECESVTTRRVLYFPFSEQTLFESQQLAHVLRRSQVSITSRKAAILHLQREIHSVLSMHSTANENVGELEAHCLTSLKELRAVQRHKVSLEDEFADNRTSGLASLEFQHRAMSEELTEAKQQKAKQLTIQSNIEKLKAWLGRQREARKVMRLYIGLEKMGRRRIKRVLETVIRGCGGNTLDEALSNYSFTLSRNSSLIHEAEYKLAQQASCILRLSSMLSELQYLTSRLSSESASSLLFRVHKTDIYEAPALMRVRLAEMTINEYEQKWKLLKLLVGKAVDSFAGMLGLLQTADPWNRGSARTNDLIPMKNPIAAVLLVEKKIVFAYERIVPWMAAFSQPPHLDSHFSHIRTRGHLDSTKSRPSVVPRSSTFLDGLTGRGVSLMKIGLKSISLSEKAVKNEPKIADIRKEWEEIQRKTKKMDRNRPCKRLSDLIFDLKSKESHIKHRTSKGKSMDLHLHDSKYSSIVSPRSYGTVFTETALSSRKTDTVIRSDTFTDLPKTAYKRLF